MIKPKQTYFKNVDKIIDHIDLDGKAMVENEDKFKQTSCWHLQSTVSQNRTVPAGIYLVNSLTAEQLELSKDVIKDV